MRKPILIFFLVNIAIVVFLTNSVWTLLSLLIVDGSEDAISRAELPGPHSEHIAEMPQVIPKIIHQTYANNSIPDVWREAQQSCMELHKDYEYMFWTNEGARAFIVEEYPWFLETWDSYPFNIQRADAIRYFVLLHYGGIYIDLDDGCQRRLDPLLQYPAWVRRTIPTGISNDVMGSIPGHPFFLQVIDSLPKYNRNWVAPYITIMSSTGPLFLSVIWRHFNGRNLAAADRVRILFPGEYQGYSWSFFTHHPGSSWHRWDSQAMFWCHDHWPLLTFAGFTIAGFVFVGLWWAWGRVFSTNSPRRSMRPRFTLWRTQSFEEEKILRKHDV